MHVCLASIACGGILLPNIIYNTGESEIIEKYSRFYGYTAPSATEADARAAIAYMRERYPQAGHFVYAYDIQQADRRITRQSDDGEPHGTAGMPILHMFTHKEIINFVCVVARIFGGVLLGKGGLVRAYTACAKESLDAAGYGRLIVRRQYDVTLPYPEWDKFKYTLHQHGIQLDDVTFTAHCVAAVTVTDEQEAIFRKITEQKTLTERSTP
jgi:uncharacterized YigZ family protein